MPMDLSRYPKNWKAIAHQIKKSVNWNCEECNRPCRQPGEKDGDLCERMNGSKWSVELYEKVDNDEFVIPIPKFGRFTLTVAHLDHVPENCDRANLKALCTVCHCRLDLKAMPLKRRLKLEREGQLNLFSTPHKS